MKTSRTKTKNYSHLQKQKTYAEAFIDACDFFKRAGVIFREPEDTIPRHAIEILIDNDVKGIDFLNIFSMRMSQETLVNVQSRLTEGFKKESDGMNLVRAINAAVSDLYGKGCTTSYALASAKIPVAKVMEIIRNIIYPPIDYSMGNDSIDTWPKLYKALGGFMGVKVFFMEAFKAAEKSLPLDGEGRISMRNELPKIKCYTCEHCKVGPTGIRTCGKVETAITGAQFDKHPNRYTDAHRSGNTGKLVSAVIDKRMDTCENYVCRIK